MRYEYTPALPVRCERRRTGLRGAIFEPVAEDTLQRTYDLREVYNRLCWLAPDRQRGVLAHAAARRLALAAVYQQTQRWLQLT